jgi:hypothetical protein
LLAIDSPRYSEQVFAPVARYLALLSGLCVGLALASGCRAESSGPAIDAVVPAQVSAAQRTPIEIRGVGFFALPRANYDDPAKSGIDAVFVVTLRGAGTHILAPVTLDGRTRLSTHVPAGLPLGVYDVEVRVPDGRSARRAEALTVVDGTAPDGSPGDGADGDGGSEADASADGAGDGAGDGAADQQPGEVGADLPPADDASPPDLTPDASAPCVSQADPSTVALYTFEGSGAAVSDLTGQHPGTLVGSAWSRGPGPAGCGEALVFPSSSVAADYVSIPDASAWDLTLGSVDFWVRIDSAASSVRGIVSRDANGHVKPGHLSFLQLCDGGIAVRLQHTANDRDVQCSAPLSLGVWHHVGANFGAGGLTLQVDGVLATRTDTINSCGLKLQCGTSTSLGIDGNDNPWVLGVSSQKSAEGSATPTTNPFHGAIDSFRISSKRRSFN